jgi:hypothetical protein
MKAPELSARDRRALLLGLLVLVPALVFAFGVKPYLARVEAAEAQLLTQRRLLQRELALLTDVRRYPERLEAVERALHAEVPRLFGGSDGVTATAALAGYVDRAARSSRVLVQQSESRGAEVLAPGVLELGVTIRAVGDVEGILTLLHALEEGGKLVRIEGLSIERIQRIGFPGSPDEAPLSLSATVAGFAVLPLAADARPRVVAADTGGR